MLSLLDRLSVRQRIWTIVALFLGGIVLAGTLHVVMLRQALWHDKEIQTRQLVESSLGVVAHFYDLQQRGDLSEAAAQAAAQRTLQAMRYEETEYVWINDLGTPLPKMIMHPTMPDLEGQRLDAKQFNCATRLRIGTDGPFTETDGQTNLFAAAVDVVTRGSDGYVTYDWPKPLREGGVTQERYPKLSYVKAFRPWGWLVGSGVYIDDVEATVSRQVGHNVLLVAVTGLVMLMFASVMARSIVQPLRLTVATMRTIGQNGGGLGQRLPICGHSEISELATNFNAMLARLQSHEAELARHQEYLEAEVARRTAELQESNRRLEAELAERRLAEQALHDSEEKFRSICTTAQDAIILLNADGNVSYWNDAAVTMFGYCREEVLGRELHELAAPERFRESFCRGFEQFRQTGKGAAVGQTLELAGLRKDGSEFPIELSISAIRLHGQWAAVGFVRDISERKNAEQTIRENRARMRALLDATCESVLLLEPEGNILAINAFAAQRFGQTPEAMVGQNFFGLMPSALAASRQAAVQHVAMSGEPLHNQDRRGPIWFDNSLYPVLNESGQVESVAVYAKDVTDFQLSRATEDIFRHADTMLLKWRMNLESIAQLFCDDLLPVFDLAAAWIGRAEKDGRLTVLAGAQGGSEHFLESMCARDLRWQGGTRCCLPTAAVIRTGARQLIAEEDGTCKTCETAMQTADARSILLLPLIVQGDAWGILALYGRDRAAFTGAQSLIRLDRIAGRLGAALESALQQEWLTLLDTALAEVSNAVFITDASAKICWVNRAFETLTGFASKEILGQTPKLFDSGRQDAAFYRSFWQTIQAGRTWQGDLVNLRRDGSAYSVHQTVTPLLDAQGLVGHFVAILEDITERQAAEERIRHSANFDLLTDLPNRGLFRDRLSQALALARRDNQLGAVLFLDLDHFKAINDEFGHAAGDSLLVAVAERLRQQVRESDTVARLAGDEFTVILPRIHDREDAGRVADKIVTAIARPLSIAGKNLAIGVSIGIALFPEQGDTVDQVLNAADHAMYLAKQSGRNRFAWFDRASLAEPADATLDD